MMALRYVYLSVCYLVLFLDISAVADISIDYYFGNEEPLRTAGHILVAECGTASMKRHCFQKCGPDHACLLGQCFCIKARASSKSEEVLDRAITEEETNIEENTGSENFYDNEDDEQEFPYNNESENIEEELVEQPAALRHHIAHFCPNLDIARLCIKKCLNLGLPAFCGKDHVCYCGHKYPNSKKGPMINPEIVRNQFRDLYVKYFGRNTRGKSRS